jgi:glycosyltransferase involved in cell wall biosynthesis
LKTLLNQTLKDIEIICVLDCPTDGTDKIVREYAAKDERIRLIHNESNLHVAESRNKGMQIAQGEYIGFSDADDYHEPDMYEKLYQAGVANQSEIVFSNSYIVNNEITTRVNYQDPSINGIIKSIILPMEHPSNKNYLSDSVWSSVYKREFLQNHLISFKNRNIYFLEDTLFNLEAFLSVKKVTFVDEAFYYWVKNEGSLSNQWVTNVAEKSLNYYEYVFQLLKERNRYDEFRKEFIESVDDSLCSYFSYYKNLPKELKIRLKKLLINAKYPIFSKFRNLKLISKKRVKLYWFISVLLITR